MAPPAWTRVFYHRMAAGGKGRLAAGICCLGRPCGAATEVAPEGRFRADEWRMRRAKTARTSAADCQVQRLHPPSQALHPALIYGIILSRSQSLVSSQPSSQSRLVKEGE
jgi:hypothetical protein